MGASVGMAHGISKASDNSKKAVAVIGNSTFVPSGITGIIDAGYNKSDIFVLILDNSTTGMTGHQDHPATGYTIRGEETFKLDLLSLCKTIGCSVVEEINPYSINENIVSIKYSDVDKIISELGVKFYKIDIPSLITQIGNPRVQNTIMLGAFSKFIGIEESFFKKAIENNVKPEFATINLKAFEIGRNIDLGEVRI
nr:thiamine pyrophosphate-dependent enzyme [Caldicellulosiruptor naganoensis]